MADVWSLRCWPLALALTCACTPGAGADAGPADGSAPDGAMPDAVPDATADSSTDGSIVDGGIAMDADTAADAAVDASDAAWDAAPCDPATCVPSGECVTASCVAGACVEVPVADGTACGEVVGGLATHVCVAGDCVWRGCGDGYREPGPMPAREGCDDGNASEADACSSACQPQVIDIDVPPDGSFEAALGVAGPAMAQSSAGPLLVVWLRDRFDHAELVARRYSAAGVAEPLATDPIVLDATASAFDASPSVAALPGAAGWVVVWLARRADHARVLYRFVSRFGALGPERVADEEPSNQAAEPRVAALSDGFVIAWTATLATSADPAGGVRARVFDAAGDARSPSFLPASEVSQREEAPVLASSGDDWLLLYAASSLAPSGSSELRARRFSGEAPLDVPALTLDAAGGHSATATALAPSSSGEARYALGFVHAGQVFVATLEPSPLDLGSSLHALTPAGADGRAVPRVARYGTGTLMAFEHGFPSRLEVLSETMALPTEISVLLSDWAGSAEGPVDVQSTPSGTWFVWAGSEGPLRTRAVRAFRLAAP